MARIADSKVGLEVEEESMEKPQKPLPYWVCGDCGQTCWDTKKEALECAEHDLLMRTPFKNSSHSTS